MLHLALEAPKKARESELGKLVRERKRNTARVVEARQKEAASSTTDEYCTYFWPQRLSAVRRAEHRV